MWSPVLVGLLAAGGFAAAWLWRHRACRKSHLDRLASQRPDLIRDTTIQLAATESQLPAGQFSTDHIARIENFVTPKCLQVLREEALAHIPDMKRTFIPTHKKGAALSYEKIHTLAPHCLAFYHNAEVQRRVAEITGETIFPTPDQDQSSLSILCYHEPGDHINWHYDHNFYRGRHFTVLLSLVNEGKSEVGSAKAEGKESTSAFRLPTSALRLSRGTYLRQLPGGGTQDYDTSPNTLIVFEGAKVRHRASPVGPEERRVILSMTYCTDPQISRFKEFVRRVKDTAFFGIRALWD